MAPTHPPAPRPTQTPAATAPRDEPSPHPPIVQYPASDRPATRADRIAFQVWIIFFLLVIVFTLLNYLLTWLLPARAN